MNNLFTIDGLSSEGPGPQSLQTEGSAPPIDQPQIPLPIGFVPAAITAGVVTTTSDGVISSDKKATRGKSCEDIAHWILNRTMPTVQDTQCYEPGVRELRGNDLDGLENICNVASIYCALHQSFLIDKVADFKVTTLNRLMLYLKQCEELSQQARDLMQKTKAADKCLNTLQSSDDGPHPQFKPWIRFRSELKRKVTEVRLTLMKVDKRLTIALEIYVKLLNEKNLSIAAEWLKHSGLGILLNTKNNLKV